MNSTYMPNFRIFCRSAAEIWGGGGIRPPPPPRTWDRQKSPALLGLSAMENENTFFYDWKTHFWGIFVGIGV